MLRACSAVSKDFFSRKFSSPSSTTKSCRRNSRARPRRLAIHAVAQRSDIDIRLAQTASADSCNAITSRSSPMAKPIPERCGPPSDSDKPVVSPAAEDRVLRAQRSVRELKRRSRVVIQPSHQAVVQREGNADGVSGSPAPLRNVCGKASSRNCADARKLLDDRLVLGNFAVKHAQRIGDGAALAIHAHVRRDRLERFAQRLVVTRRDRSGIRRNSVRASSLAMPSRSSNVASISSTSASRAGDSLPAVDGPITSAPI